MVEPLTDLFYATGDADVRSACVAAITEFAEDGTPPSPLFVALSDRDAGVVLNGISALTDFPDARAWEPLCRFIDSRVNVLFNQNAMMQLGHMGDDRAVPTLVRVLLDTKNSFDQNFATAGMALARCGPRGFDALVAALGHKDARIRFAAVVGLDVSGDPRAAAFLDKMEGDAEPRVRERAKMRTGNSTWK